MFEVLSVAKYELRMQIRRKFIWPLAAFFLLVMFYLTSPFNEPGLMFSSERLAAHSLFLALLFSSLVYSFLVSDRISRDDALLTRELIRTAPFRSLHYVVGKIIGSIMYFLLLFIFPVFLLMQIMQILFAGLEGWNIVPFLKIGWFAIVSAFFISAVALYTSRLLGDNVKFFIGFSCFWGVMFLLTVPGSLGILRALDFTGKHVGQVLLPPDRFSLPEVEDWVFFALNISCLLALGIVCVVLLAKNLDQEQSTPQREKRSAYVPFFCQVAPIIGYTKEILVWKDLKMVLAFVIISSIVLLKTFKGNISMLISYFEIFLPLLFAFTVTHIFKAERDFRLMELILVKPISRLKVLSQRYGLLLAPNIVITLALSLIVWAFHKSVDVGLLLAASLATTVFLCTLSMTIAVATKSSGIGAAGAVFWVLFWINGDVQQSVNAESIFFLINPFAATFYSDSPHIANNKLALFGSSGFLFFIAVAFLRKSERFLR